MINTSKVIALFFLVVFCTACATKGPIPLYDTKPDSVDDVAILTMPVEIDVIYLDGVNLSLITSYKAFIDYALLPGNHVLGLQYEDILTNSDESQEVIKSPMVALKFYAKPGERYKINFNKPATFSEAVKLEKKLELSLSDQNGIIARSFPAAQIAKSSLLLDDSSNTSPIDDLSSNMRSDPAPSKTQPPTVHLKYWWKQASEQEKNNFKNWLKNNP